MRKYLQDIDRIKKKIQILLRLREKKLQAYFLLGVSSAVGQY